MGAFLSLIKGAGGGSEADPIDMPIDFNGIGSTHLASPTSEETEYATFQQVTTQFPAIISLIEGYTGCGEYIRQVRVYLI